MKSIFKRDFLEIYTAFKKPKCGKWKIGLFSNNIRWNFENQLSRTTIHFTLKTSGKSCVRKWQVWSKRAIVLSPKLSNNGCQDWDNSHSRKTLHCKKKSHNCHEFKATTVWHLTHLNCQLDHGMKKTEIAETNGALFRTLRNKCFDSHTVSSLLKHKHRLSISDFLAMTHSAWKTSKMFGYFSHQHLSKRKSTGTSRLL